jgi:glycosyltransferase involved in cell wall biosynthesis
LNIDSEGGSIHGRECAVSVIIPVFQDIELLDDCLFSLHEQTFDESYEVLVVDNDVSTEIKALVAKYPKARYLQESKRGSYNARNCGLRAARGQIIAFTDADCVPARDWLARCAENLWSGDGSDAIGGRIVLTATPQRHSGELFELAFRPFNQQYFVTGLKFAATANMAVRKAVIDSVGDFNGTLLTGGDLEWGRRLFASGFRMKYADDAVVFHPARRTLGSLIRRHRRLSGGRVIAQDSTEQRFERKRQHIERRKENFDSLSALLFKPESISMTRSEAMRAIFVALLISLVRLGEYVRVRLGGRAAR